MACLLPCSHPTASSQQCISAASGLLQEALRVTLGLPQPRLLNLLQVGCCSICNSHGCDFTFACQDWNKNALEDVHEIS